jgi:hypothetical protein
MKKQKKKSKMLAILTILLVGTYAYKFIVGYKKNGMDSALDDFIKGIGPEQFYLYLFLGYFLLGVIVLSNKIIKMIHGIVNNSYYLNYKADKPTSTLKSPYEGWTEEEEKSWKEIDRSNSPMMLKAEHERVEEFKRKMKSYKTAHLILHIILLGLHCLGTYLLYQFDPVMWVFPPLTFVLFFGGSHWFYRTVKKKQIKSKERSLFDHYRN